MGNPLDRLTLMVINGNFTKDQVMTHAHQQASFYLCCKKARYENSCYFHLKTNFIADSKSNATWLLQ